MGQAQRLRWSHHLAVLRVSPRQDHWSLFASRRACESGECVELYHSTSPGSSDGSRCQLCHCEHRDNNRYAESRVERYSRPNDCGEGYCYDEWITTIHLHESAVCSTQ